LKRGRTGLDNVRRLVDDLLAFARSGAHGATDRAAEVDRACSEVVTELGFEAEAEHVVLHVEPMEHLSVACPDTLLQDALRNLVRNAIRHMGTASPREVMVRAQPRGRTVLVEVEDTGPGLPAGPQARLFEPYVRGPDAMAPGLGLGLATVKRIIEAHRGEVGARNHAPHGALFWFTLPAQ
jgi:signal transduction histidine kinase